MPYEESVAANYTHGRLLDTIQAGIGRLGKSPAQLTLDDLAPMDEFHIGGRAATSNLLDQLGFSEYNHVLDVGCGLGGACRHIAHRYNNRVSGIDLTEEYVHVGNTLCRWVGLEQRVALHHGSALAMPFADASFDGAVMLHVGMNIADKAALFAEVNRVLRPRALFGIYDVMRLNDGELTYPVPWASEPGICSLATPEQYRTALSDAGFTTSGINVRRESALEFFNQVRARTRAADGPPPLGLHVLMQDSTAVKIDNMIENVTAGLIAPVEMIARK